MCKQVRAAGGKPVFLRGEVVTNPKTGLPQFVPGVYEEEGGRFVPGMVVDTIDGPMFVEGVLHRLVGQMKLPPNPVQLWQIELPNLMSTKAFPRPFDAPCNMESGADAPITGRLAECQKKSESV